MIELRNIKHNKAMSEETECFSADIYLAGGKIGWANNRGHGGATIIHINDAGIEAQLETYAASLPPLELGEGLRSIPMNTEHLVDKLLSEHLVAKQLATTLRRWCKTQVVIKLKGTKVGEYTTYAKRGSDEANPAGLYALIKQREGDKLDFIVNERLAKGQPLV